MGKKTSPNTAPQVQQLEGGRKLNVDLYLEPEKVTKLNIFVMTLIAVLYFVTDLFGCCGHKGVQMSEKDLLRQRIQQSKKNLEEIERDCPTAMEEHDNCYAKLEECHKTDVEFKKANQEMIGAVRECESVNAENIALNEKINGEIARMDEALQKLQ